MSEPSKIASSPFPWPPVIYLTSVVASGLAAGIAGWPFEPAALRVAATATGGLIIVLGVGVGVTAGRLFAQAGTPVPPTRPTMAIVTSGIYNHTRNPMYLGMSLVLAGLGLVFDQLWFLLALPFAMFTVTKLAIKREEAYLTEKFGAPYVAYAARVRRWL
jgi:protein-S-isoprenylcysteine O-methyltransferase Ste14